MQAARNCPKPGKEPQRIQGGRLRSPLSTQRPLLVLAPIALSQKTEPQGSGSHGQRAQNLWFALTVGSNLASLVAQLVKNLSTMPETWLWPQGWEIPWRRAWRATPVFLPHGQRSLVCCSPWSCKESDKTERLSTAKHSAWEIINPRPPTAPVPPKIISKSKTQKDPTASKWTATYNKAQEHSQKFKNIHCGSDSKESACNAGD